MVSLVDLPTGWYLYFILGILIGMCFTLVIIIILETRCYTKICPCCYHRDGSPTATSLHHPTSEPPNLRSHVLPPSSRRCCYPNEERLPESPSFTTQTHTSHQQPFRHTNPKQRATVHRTFGEITPAQTYENLATIKRVSSFKPQPAPPPSPLSWPSNQQQGQQQQQLKPLPTPPPPLPPPQQFITTRTTTCVHYDTIREDKEENDEEIIQNLQDLEGQEDEKLEGAVGGVTQETEKPPPPPKLRSVQE